MSAAAEKLAALRGSLSRFDKESGGPVVPLGHAGADAVLQGGLRTGTLHEVFAVEGRQGATATGFAAALALRAASRRAILWIRQDFAARELGELSLGGFAELGLDPRHIIVVRAPEADSALRVAADCLACNALGTVVLEIWGEASNLDLVASRKLTLAAQASGVTNILLRFAASPRASTAETRWTIRAAASPDHEVWGAPVFDAELIRNRHGRTGRFIMEWNGDDCLFTPAPSRAVAALPGDRPAAADEVSRPISRSWRRAG
jgi:protein ImuA